VDEVRRLRLEKGWSQNELAYHAKLAPSVISLLETGKRDPNATTLRKLADALEVRIPDLFEEAGSGKARRRSSPEPSLFNGLEEERRLDRPEVREWLAEHGHRGGEQFLSEAETLENEADIERASQELHRKRDELLAALRRSETRKALFPIPSGLSREETRNWLLKPPGQWELGSEIRHEYLARELALVNLSRQLFVEGKASDYLVYGPPGEHDHARHERLLEERRRVLRESYAKATAA